MLELLRERRAPSAILMGKADAILALGVVVGIELGYVPVPIVEVSAEVLGQLADGAYASVEEDGTIRVG
jgi:predicted aconitase with swiveling domain